VPPLVLSMCRAYPVATAQIHCLFQVEQQQAVVRTLFDSKFSALHDCH
jgi:hypothetical protein